MARKPEVVKVEKLDDAPVVALRYDYEQLDPEVRAVAMHAACTVKLCAAMTVAAALTTGEQLAVAKGRIPAGRWLDWLKTEFEWTDRTARNYMSVHQLFREDRKSISDFSNISLDAAYLLTQKAIPNEIKKGAINLLIKGQNVTRKMVIEMLGVPEEAQLPKEEKHTDIRRGPIEPERMLIDTFNALEGMREIKPADAAAAVTPILRQRFHDRLLRIADPHRAISRYLQYRDPPLASE
jgi:hypothetical protein